MSLFQHSKIPISGQQHSAASGSNVALMKIERPKKTDGLGDFLKSSTPAQHSPKDELVLLHKEVSDELAKLEANSDRYGQLLQPETFNAKKSELKAILTAVEETAAKNGINLKPDSSATPKQTSKLDEWKKTLLSIKTASKDALAAAQKQTDAKDKELIISNDLEIAQMDLLLKRAIATYDKLRILDEVIGDPRVFEGKSVSQALEEEMEALQTLDKLEIQRNTKKVEYMASEVNKTQSESKHHLVDNSAKKEITEFLTDFFKDFSERDIDNVSKLIHTTVENIELRADFLNQTTKISEIIAEHRNILKEAITMSEENHEALRNLRSQTAVNVQVLKANKRSKGK